MLNTENIQSLIDSGEGYNVVFKVRVPSKIRELTEDLPMSVKVYLPISLLVKNINAMFRCILEMLPESNSLKKSIIKEEEFEIYTKGKSVFQSI